MKKLLVVLLTISMILTISACGTQSSSNPTQSDTPQSNDSNAQNNTSENDDEILIGLSCALTGNFPLAGQRTREGVDLALEEVNAKGGVLGKKLAYTIEDDQNTQTTAVNVVTKILTKNVSGVIGPHTSGNAMATNELYKNAKVPFMTGGTSPKLSGLNNDYFFRVRPEDTINGQVAAKYALEKLGAKKIGISFNNNDFGTGGRDVIIEYLKKVNVPYVAVGHNSGDKDLTGQIMKLKSEGVDAIISWTDDAEVVLTARQLYELGFKVPVIASAGVVMDQVLNLMEPEYIEGWYSVTDFVSTNNSPIVIEFVKNFENKYGYKPELYAATYYSATYVLADAIERAGSADPQAVRDALAQTKGLQLPEGVFTTDGKGNMLQGCIVAQILNKVPTMIEYVDLNN
ncbi:ABC transporter substrate-binding protein [Petroclostridium sp. X23]|uniref:ABC transporter substrate-binding protein n=1 Tax=Petroclostridium sp. X23 TaxID=3045146 RepID=UPI0024AE7D94|nr:ABC transporter substrate-binding protein [Petroclostridium sp. X23]WHH58007.1 ABC transporter substrate-binding protein [Petroclostridium sp. X23]